MFYRYRLPTATEITQAKLVFGNSLPYDNIYLANGFLPANQNVAVTVMSYSGGGNSFEPAMKTPRVQNFAIYWGEDIYNRGADVVGDSMDTFIHELTHVWQGYNENGAKIFNYMIRALAAQSWAVVSHLDRNQAYEYDPNNYLKWSEYNPEQQGKIVENWFSGDPNKSRRGNGSTSDPRFVYIDKVIRPGKPYATDIPSLSQPVQQMPNGFSLAVQAYQRLLIKKGYRIKDDGLNGQNTDRAVRDFQRRNGLKVSGVVGPKTLALLNRP